MINNTSKPHSRSFFWLNITQFLGALNDNLFKLILIFFLISLQGIEAAGKVSALAGAIFVVPFLVFSPLAGVVADRVAKSKLSLEILVMTIGALALWFSSPIGLYVALFLMALQSTIFSPAKYGIVPELVSREGLSKANGQIEAFTYLAIIIGTSSATLIPMFSGGYHLAGVVTTVIALIGFAASTRINEVYPAREQETARSSVVEMRHALRLVRNDGNLAMAVLGSSLFMLVGAFVQLNLIPYGIQEFGLSQEQSGALFLLAALGIGFGSLLAGRLSGRNVELGIVPIGALMLFLSVTFMGLANGDLATISLAIQREADAVNSKVIPNTLATISATSLDAKRGSRS